MATKTGAGSSPSNTPQEPTPAPAPTPAPTKTTPPAQPAAAPAPTPAKPDGTAEDHKVIADVLSTLTPEQRDRVLEGEDIRTVTGLEPTPTPPTPEPEPAPAPGPEPTPAAPEPAPTPEPPEPGEPETLPEELRPRFKNQEDIAIALLAKTKGITLLEAADFYRGTKPPVPDPAKPAEPPAPPPEVATIDAERIAIADRIKALKTQRTQAREEVDYTKADELSDEIAEATARLGKLETHRDIILSDHETSQAQRFSDEVGRSAGRVYAKFPVLSAATNLERMAFDNYVDRAMSNPQRAALFQSPAWPEVLADEFARVAKLTPNGKAAPAGSPPASPTAPSTRSTAPTPKPAVVQTPPNARLTTGPDGSLPSTPRPSITPTDAISTLGTLSPQDRRELADKLDL